MTVTIDANTLNLGQVHYLLHLEKCYNNSISSHLNLAEISEYEQKKLAEIRNLADIYSNEGNILEGEIKFLFLSPLLWLSGFYNPQIKITLEEEIERINIEDEETTIKGRMDVLAAERIKHKSTETAL